MVPVIRRLRHWLTSYPMVFLWHAFNDVVANQPVNLYVDRHGNLWHAHHRWAWFRVEAYDKKTARSILSTAIYRKAYGGTGR
jgi:hypothetical protein